MRFLAPILGLVETKWQSDNLWCVLVDEVDWAQWCCRSRGSMPETSPGHLPYSHLWWNIKGRLISLRLSLSLSLSVNLLKKLIAEVDLSSQQFKAESRQPASVRQRRAGIFSATDAWKSFVLVDSQRWKVWSGKRRRRAGEKIRENFRLTYTHDCHAWKWNSKNVKKCCVVCNGEDWCQKHLHHLPQTCHNAIITLSSENTLCYLWK